MTTTSGQSQNDPQHAPPHGSRNLPQDAAQNGPREQAGSPPASAAAPLVSGVGDVAFETLARGLRLLLFDVDGVLTDGRILLHADGTESKQYHIRDGTGLVLARRGGLLTGLLSARTSQATLARAQQLSIPIVRQGAGNKLTAYEEILAEHALTDREVAFMGDDLQDLPVLARVGLSCAPADAVPEVRARVRWISSYGGGAGAVRELIERVLRARGAWDGLISAYLPEQRLPEGGADGAV